MKKALKIFSASLILLLGISSVIFLYNSLVSMHDDIGTHTYITEIIPPLAYLFSSGIIIFLLIRTNWRKNLPIEEGNSATEGTLFRHVFGSRGDDVIYNILYNLQEATAIVNDRCVILYANPVFLKLFKIEGDKFRGEDIRDFFKGRDGIKLSRSFRKVTEGMHPRTGILLTGVRRDSEMFPARLNVSPLRQHERISFLLSLTDESQRLEFSDRISHLEKLSSIGTFASGIVHEFNNVLTGIRGYSQLARQDLSNTELIEKAFTIIELESQRGSELCRNMSLYSSRTKINLEPTSLPDLLETVLSLQQKFFDHENISIMREVEAMPLVMLDRFQVQQVLVNLVINARHALMPKGGGTITLRLKPGKKDFSLEIEDDGIGIDAQNISRIFDPFYTSKGPIGKENYGKEIKGSGLGLSVSHSIIKKHNGSITVHSHRGLGTSFRITLPMIFPPAEEKAEKPPLYQLPTYPAYERRSPLKVLIVDDEMSIREMLFKALTEIEIDVTLARNAEEAIATCRSDKFDLIFLDYILPEMNGDKLIPIIKEYSPHSKIIFISGWTSSPIKKKTLEKSVHAWIEKPFDITQILNCIREIYANGNIRH